MDGFGRRLLIGHLVDGIGLVPAKQKMPADPLVSPSQRFVAEGAPPGNVRITARHDLRRQGKTGNPGVAASTTNTAF
jgi:hypothetical protein